MHNEIVYWGTCLTIADGRRSVNTFLLRKCRFIELSQSGSISIQRLKMSRFTLQTYASCTGRECAAELR